MRKRWNTPLLALIGFVALGCFVIGKGIVAAGFGSEPIGYWLGTAIGAGLSGAAIGALIGYFRNRSIAKSP